MLCSETKVCSASKVCPKWQCHWQSLSCSLGSAQAGLWLVNRRIDGRETKAWNQHSSETREVGFGLSEGATISLICPYSWLPLASSCHVRFPPPGSSAPQTFHNTITSRPFWFTVSLLPPTLISLTLGRLSLPFAILSDKYGSFEFHQIILSFPPMEWSCLVDSLCSRLYIVYMIAHICKIYIPIYVPIHIMP